MVGRRLVWEVVVAPLCVGFTGQMTTRGMGRRVFPTWLFLAVFLLGSCADDSETPPAAEGEESSSTADAPSGCPDPSTSGDSQSGTYTVDGRELLLDCVGEGDTTMVLEVGEGLPYQALAPISDAYESQMRVCSYDRASTGGDIASDLHGLLTVAEVPGPYLLVGHSAGGLLVQAYAAAYPDETVGVVAMNPVPAWQAWSTLGFEEMTPQERQGETEYYAGANGESLEYREVSQQIAESPVPRSVPLHVLISTVAQCESPKDICGRTYPAYEKIAKDLAQRWGEGRFSQVEAPHEIHLADMEAVQRAIDDVISRSQP
jgi:pimeloyl-ACP methyl ester carboxylesterase